MALASILAVDGTAEVLGLTTAVLEEAGYDVVCCGGSREALTILNDGHAIDLLLTDVVMPEMDGFELARRAMAMRPSLIIAYLSGYPRAPPEDTQELFGPILRKPYRAQDLVRRIDELLGPAEDARSVRVVASQMIKRHPDALERATEEQEIARMRGDDLSERAWQDIADAISRQRRH